ncbi:MAG TPA: hypothetical protein VIH75_21915 [Candidatus Sulfotelmatobacter sp.]|jgi:hypothetical protein
MFRHLTLLLAMALPVVAQDSGTPNKNLDITSPVGDLHVGNDADARKAGLPLYPGARPKRDGQNKDKDKDKDKDSDQANLSLLTEAFGMKLVVAKYDSDDGPAKIIDFYRDKLKKYGKVLECHSKKHGGDVEADVDSKDSSDSKELKCDENSGPVTELKVGTEDDQHIVAIEPRDAGKGSTFALVYLRTRGKRGDL